MTEKSRRRLEWLARVTEADTSAEVIRNSLRLYETMVSHVISGKEFILRDKATGMMAVYEPFYNVDAQPEAEASAAATPRESEEEQKLETLSMGNAA
jgi:hypothetical protein